MSTSSSTRRTRSLMRTVRAWRTRTSVLGVLTTVGATAVSTLALIGPAPASAETPAERCARETATYNSAWAQSWAASNGKPADLAPPPPVPYVCVDPGPPTSSTTPPPSVTAPGIPSDSNVPETGGPDIGAHAPTDIPDGGSAPIVPIPTTGPKPGLGPLLPDSQRSQASELSCKPGFEKTAIPTMTLPGVIPACVQKEEKGVVDPRAWNIDPAAQCTILTDGGDCRAERDETRATVVRGNVGAEFSGVSASAGVDTSTSKSVRVACTSPKLSAGQRWVAWPDYKLTVVRYHFTDGTEKVGYVLTPTGGITCGLG